MPGGGAVDGLYQDYEADDQVASRFAEVLEIPVYDAKPLYWKAVLFIVTSRNHSCHRKLFACSPGRNPPD